MRRREFITLIGGAAAAWPLAARAQQRMRRIGVLMGLAEDDPEGRSRLAALSRALQDLGWIEGHNIRTDFRWACLYRKLNSTIMLVEAHPRPATMRCDLRAG
jgi:putative ABC transport system substrate-binding protein